MKSPFTTGSFILPIGIGLFGVLHTVFGPHAEGDWLGMGIILKAGIWLGIAGVLSILLSITSFVRKEPRKELSLLLAVPSLLYLSWIAVSFVDANRNRAESTRLRGDYADFRLELIENPSLALEIEWDRVWDVRRTVLVGAFQESSVPFTLEQLRELYSKFPSIRDHLFAHEACDSEFLSAHFEDALSLSRNVNHTILASICSNKNTPSDLLERVANATVAFRTRSLGEEYFQDRGIERCSLVDESELDQAHRDAISGDDVFIFESSEMILEIGRRGASFPFIEFVTSYQPFDPA